MSDIVGNTKFKIGNTKSYVPIVTLSTEYNVKLTKPLNEGLKRSVYWNQYKREIKSRDLDNVNPLKILLDASFQGVKRLFLLAFNNTTVDVVSNPIDNTNNRVEKNSQRKYFLPRVDTTNQNVLNDGRNFYDQPTGDQIKKYDDIRKIATKQGHDYTTGCLSTHKYVQFQKRQKKQHQNFTKEQQKFCEHYR